MPVTPRQYVDAAGGTRVPTRGVTCAKDQIRGRSRQPAGDRRRAAFFPPSHAERKEEKATRELRAKEICHQCHVRGDCLEYAIRIREPHGIWGGLNEVERKMVLDRRAS